MIDADTATGLACASEPAAVVTEVIGKPAADHQVYRISNLLLQPCFGGMSHPELPVDPYATEMARILRELPEADIRWAPTDTRRPSRTELRHNGALVN